jgi:flagellar hook-associated protein 2
MASISSPGIGSGLDVSGIVSKLMQVESQPLTILATKESTYQAKLTAYGSLKGALSAFQSSVSALSSPSKFQIYNATSSDSTVLSASATSTAAPGNYSIVVGQLAQAQTIASSGQASTTTAIGAGTSTTLTFQFGTISGGALAAGVYAGSTYTQDASQASGTVTIDSTNNSMQGIRDAINAANMGVTATIVNDGNATNPYHLVLTSNNTGLSKSMKISVGAGDATIQSLLAYDPAATQNLTQSAVAQNATATVNGVPISSASNTVTGVVQGVTLNLVKAGTTSLSVARDTASVTSAISAFVKAYNDTNTTLKNFTSYNATTKQAGILLGDSATRSIQNQMRSTLSSALGGLGSSSLTTLSQVGISFQKDGSLALDTAKLNSAISSNFNDIAGLFATVGKPTDSLVNYLSSTANTQAGSYALSVTSLATNGAAVGVARSTAAMQFGQTGSVAAGLNITTASNDTFNVAVDGGIAVLVTLPQGLPYASAAALSSQVQTSINAALTAGGQGTKSVSVAADANGKLSITSNTFGGVSGVSVTPDGVTTGAASLLGTPAASSFSTITAGSNDQLTLSVDGTSATVTLAAGRYSASALAAQIQSAINGALALIAAGSTVSVTQSADVLSITSSSYGSTSTVSVTGGSGMANLFGAAPTASTGVNAAGTINGMVATGSGQFLTGAAGDEAEGLQVQIAGGMTGARGTVNFSQGYASRLNTLMTGFLASTGSIASRTDGINSSITDIGKQRDVLNQRLAAIEARYRKQFTALDSLISSMNTTSSSLAAMLANLPKISA